MRATLAASLILSFPDGELMYITQPDYRSGYTDMPWGGSANFGVFGEGAFAYDARGLLFYLKYADKAGILKDLPSY